MEPTIKVSIAGVAFTLEQDAYKVIENYLKALENHFANKADANEIIADIEYRMSELFQIRSNAQNIITLSDAQEIISIMGNPKDFEDNPDNSNYLDNEEPRDEEKFSFESLKKKKLYRDTDHKILGGVCSGLGHFFKIDPIVFRLIFILPILIPIFLSIINLHNRGVRIGPGLFILYIILWIVIPKAQTFKEKLSMTGTNPSIEDIENGPSTNTSNKYRGSILRSIILGIFYFVVAVVGILACLTLVTITIAFFVLLINNGAWNIDNLLAVVGFQNSVDLKIMTFLGATLPLIGICYLAFKILKRSRFTTGNFIISLIAFCSWIGISVYLMSIGTSFAMNYRSNVTDTDIIPTESQSDIFYINIDSTYLDALNLWDNDRIFSMGENKDNPLLFATPLIHTEEDASLESVKINIQKRVYGKTKASANRKIQTTKLDYQLTDSLLTIKPTIYSKENPWHGETFKITVILPPGKKLVIDQLLKESHKKYTYRHRNWHNDDDDDDD